VGWTGISNRPRNRPGQDRGDFKIRARDKLLTIRVSEEEREKIRELAQNRGVSAAAFIIELVEAASKKKKR